MENGAQTMCSLLGGWQFEGNAGVLDGLLGAADPLRHCGFGYKKRFGDFRRGQSAHRPQRKGNRGRQS